jgi:TRAP-type mannitol/chloroaromatic compound transport system substrate-binding protein
MRPSLARLALLALAPFLVMTLALPDEAAAQRGTTVRWKMASAFASGLDVVGESGPIFSENLRKMSGGQLDVKFFEPGALVPPFEVFDAVSKGSIEAGWTTPGFPSRSARRRGNTWRGSGTAAAIRSRTRSTRGRA